ncbi:MAG: hypothetical protein RQ847_06780 [Wenzhouxiangellaceae bacterium]|nr:hypothetical protein [Wenzhouxiangellaceae bacterium]
MKALNTAIAAALTAMGASAVAQPNPATLEDDTWLSLNGTVTSVSDTTFRLDYGDGIVTVEMDDWDNYGEAFVLADGDNVTVFGEVDDDLYEKTKIEASSVYVEDLNSYFYASSADEEEIGEWAIELDPEVGDITYIGTVESVDPLAEEFTIDTGATELTVDSSPLLYNPLDDEGFQQIEKGDRVSVNGVVDSDFFEGSELKADSIVTLRD